MVISPKEREQRSTIKKSVAFTQLCPICGMQIEIGVEYNVLEQVRRDNKFPYAHIHLHGVPLHGMLCYIDKEHRIRGCGGVKSIEISRDADTFHQLMKKWANPF